MRYITHIRLEGRTQHEQHITHFKWQDGTTIGENTRADLVQWVKNGGDARVKATPDAKVVVVDANPPYLRTVANGSYTDNLLSLPRF